jgi:hypothetical protein
MNIKQVGANDGVQSDLIYESILANKKLRGFLIEPIPYYNKKLISLHKKNLHRINIMNVGI